MDSDQSRVPLGHRPTTEEESGHGVYGTPESMHHILEREAQEGIEAVFTHESRHERDRWGERFERRFHRAAYNPFDVPPSMRGMIEDGHVVLRARNI
jgi:hypothetical protein